MGYVPFRKTDKPYMLAEVAKCGLRSVLRHHLKSKGHSFVAVLVVPPTASLTVYHDAVLSLLNDDQPRGDFDFENWKVEFFNNAEEKDVSRDLERLTTADRTIVLLRKRCDLPRSLVLAADIYADIPEPKPLHFLMAARRCGLHGMTELDAEFLSTLTFRDIKAAMGVGRPYLSALRRLRAMVAASEAKEPVVLPPPAYDLSKLDRIVGHDEIKAWAASLAEDVVDWREDRLPWSDVNGGAVICGPPGTGKTRFAHAMAEACGMHMIATSAAKWQSKGHLGDYLKAMRQVFDEAAKNAPCVLFIDEIDAVGDRARASGDNESYNRQAINGLLEAMDGSDGREGVVLVAATNDVSAIDPALLRPGRLERVFHVGLPDAEERLAILRHHLTPLSLPSGIGPFAEVSEGMSGADIEMVARDVKRLARRGRRELTCDDLWASMPTVHRVSEEELKRNAVHEVGHAVVGVKLGVRLLKSVSVSEFTLASRSSMSVGETRFETNRSARRDRQHFLDEIAMLMAGVAAEEVMLGSFADGAGGLEGSDLTRATDLATMMECQHGMGSTMTSEVGEGPRDLRSMRHLNRVAWARIDDAVWSQFERAKEIVEELRPVVEIVTSKLLERKRLAGDEVRAMMAAAEAPPQLQ